ncbi:hypothetical protein [Mesorhizobium sp. B2-7-1]|uniref:hypothetical protein n=1 Tax=Mesorhizobium sp. B2-7-1 TaxID=2589909 RepID=UPI001127F0BF|nr:hypothetical protein [Mesorhizobium sp. B2-7-1]TPJ52272.1 hypothetical protein FJ471_28220 [Mesorhizobium sp. B2-7-1]
MLRIVFRFAAWLGLIAVVIVTLVPIGMRPQLGFGPEPGRVAAFFVLGLLFSIGYYRNWSLTLGVVIAAGFGLEALQILSPTRHPAFDDAVVKAAAGTLGVFAGYIVRRRVRPLR